MCLLKKLRFILSSVIWGNFNMECNIALLLCIFQQLLKQLFNYNMIRKLYQILPGFLKATLTNYLDH